MGNSNTQEASFVLNASNLQDWTKIQEQGFCQLWMHKNTKQQLQAYPIPESFARNQEQLRKYNLRKKNSEYLVSVEGIVTPGDSFLCSEPRIAYALAENIPCRLKNYKRALTFQQSLYVLSASAAGYNTLNSFFGPIQPHPDMICLNQQGKVKVWLNENLSLNEPSLAARSPYPPSNDINVAQRRTKDGVDKLIRIVEQTSMEGFNPLFIAECRKMTTYFQIVNMIPYYCQKNGIELVDKIVVPRVFENPSFRLEREMHKDYSMQHLHQTTPQNLDVSRVKTVMFRSSQVIQPQTPQTPTLMRPFQRIVQNNQGFGRIIQQSPKITFSIRASLPTALSSSPISPIKTFGRERMPPLPYQRTPTQMVFSKKSEILPPQQQVVMQKVERRSSKNQSAKSNEAVDAEKKPEVEKEVVNQFTPIQVLDQPNNEIDTKQRQKSVIRLPNQVEKQQKNEEVKVPVEDDPKEVKVNEEQLCSEQNSMNGPHSYNNYESSSQPNSNTELPKQPTKEVLDNKNFQICHNQQIHFYNQEQYSRQIFTSQLEMKSYKNSEKNIEAAPVNEKSGFSVVGDSSLHSNAEPYVAPSIYNPPHSPIIEQLQENLSSPRKQNSEIEEWQAKLNKFTKSKYSQNNESNCFESREASESKPLQLKKVENDSEVISSFVPKESKVRVEEPKVEKVNQLADLQAEDIQKYIRAKYNLTEKVSEEKKCPGDSLQIRKVESYYEKPRDKDYTSYQFDYQKEERKSYEVPVRKQYSYQPYQYKESLNQYGFIKNMSKERNEKESYYFRDSSNNAGSNYLEKENYYPFKFNEAYQPSDRVSIQLSQDTSSYRTSLPSYMPEERTSNFKKEPERLRNRVSDASKIQERYNKYVVNGPRGRTSKTNNKASRLSNQKQVSLILAEDESKISKISGISPVPVPSELNESSKRGIHDFIVDTHFNSRQGVTYERLRNLLWED